MSHGFQALISYSWSHSLDTGSTVGGSVDGGYDYDSLYNLGTKTSYYGPSNFDIRHTLSAAVTYEVPKYQGNALSALINHWALDNIFQARTGTPLDVGVSSVAFGGFQGFQRPNVVQGQPLYLTGAACAAQDGGDPCPGGKGLNEAAFTFAPNGTQGDLGRNALRAFGAWQWDTALRREFPIKERLRLQFRLEAFNLLNHPNFAPPQSTLNTPAYTSGWGLSQQMLNQGLAGGSGAVNPLYQIGGPRSLQIAAKFIF
jgi:hypothetical protein